MKEKGEASVKVCVRVRPFTRREKEMNSVCVISMEGRATTIPNPKTKEKHTFIFDRSYWSFDGF